MYHVPTVMPTQLFHYLTWSAKKGTKMLAETSRFRNRSPRVDCVETFLYSVWGLLKWFLKISNRIFGQKCRLF
ncbi:uncharacterized protein YALI1_F16180g [Yarrowia lipolytica]|uniref:Uncharacterized protein n=1 Tax=Yarrowia lipolytica TaxID=4952 RepID=A0A1D8NN38_YARLL|nr:hypothetical protein YALI1_F16180g [Yarrowia lipolytica]